MTAPTKAHREQAVRIIRPKCNQEGIRVFCISPSPQMERVAEALAQAEEAGYQRRVSEEGEAGWAVRCLDAWAAQDDERYVVVGPQYGGESWFCTCWHTINKREEGPFARASADESRIAAATALSSADPSLPQPPKDAL